jgi:hypothetical protein
MRPLFCALLAIACLTGLLSGQPAQAGLLSRGQETMQYPDPSVACYGGQCANGQCANGQCANGQCANGQCANGQCSGSECERRGSHRRPIDVNVDVSPTPVKINVSPTPVNVVSPQAEKPAVKQEAGVAVVAIAVVLIFGVALLAALAAGFHSRVTTAKKKT